MKTVNTNPAATELITAWFHAKDCEKQWAEHRRNIEEQILSLHPGLLEELETSMADAMTLSCTAQLDTLKVEAKRTIELKQEGVAELIANHPDLWGAVLRAKYEIASSKALFGLFSVASPAAEALRPLVTFKASRPYFFK